MRISYERLHAAMVQALLRTGFAPDRAKHLADIVADNTLEGSTSHGVSRFPRLLKNIQDGMVDIHANATCERAFGAIRPDLSRDLP